MNVSILNRIKRTLETLCRNTDVPMEGVWYGACRESKLDYWNYFVFNRIKTTKNNTSGMDYQTFYQIHIIHEDYIPEGYVNTVVDALTAKDESGTKLKVTQDDIKYTYRFKPNTNMVVEIATITLFHPEKRCGSYGNV